MSRTVTSKLLCQRHKPLELTKLSCWMRFPVSVKHARSRALPSWTTAAIVAAAITVTVAAPAGAIMNPVTFRFQKCVTETKSFLRTNKIFCCFYRSRRFIAIFTRACHWDLSWIKCSPHSSIAIGYDACENCSIISLYDLLSDLFRRGFRVNVYTFLMASMRGAWSLDLTVLNEITECSK